MLNFRARGCELDPERAAKSHQGAVEAPGRPQDGEG
jgi:hypothetical protein